MKIYNDTRDAIFGELYEIAIKDPNVILLSADTGAFVFKEFKKNLPKQFFNVGVSEQNTMSVAAGLALSGKRVFVFGLANFVTLRCYEQIKIDICCMELPVTILGSGMGYLYSSDGPTHHMTDNVSLMRVLPGMTVWCPSDYTMAASMVHLAYQKNGPGCILFDKGPFSHIYDQSSHDFSDGLFLLKPGKDMVVITNGIMTNYGLNLIDELNKNGIDAALVDLYRLKPINKKLLFETVRHFKRVVTVEESTILGGLGSAVQEALNESGLSIPVKSFGVPDVFRREVGSREMLRCLDGLDIPTLSKEILKWI